MPNKKGSMVGPSKCARDASFVSMNGVVIESQSAEVLLFVETSMVNELSML